MTINEQLIVPWEYSRWITLSSFLFMVPSAYAYYKQLYIYFIISFLTSLISANYWRKASHSWRRQLDLHFAKLSFVVFFMNFPRVTYMPYIITGYPCLFVLANFYFLSGKHFAKKNPIWLKYHIAFHFLVMIEQLIILDSLSSRVGL